MKKTKTKVVAPKEPVEVVEKKVVKTKKEFHLYIKVNDIVNELETDDLAKSIVSFRPEFVLIPVSIKITKGGKTVDRYIQKREALRLFNNPLSLDVFVRDIKQLF